MISYYKIKAYRNYVRRDKFLRVREVSIMERIKTIATRDLTKSVKTGGCGECQTSCQSFCKPYAAFAGRHFFV